MCKGLLSNKFKDFTKIFQRQDKEIGVYPILFASPDNFFIQNIIAFQRSGAFSACPHLYQIQWDSSTKVFDSLQQIKDFVIATYLIRIFRLKTSL